ncbi:MAG TPA: hypothetical protein VGB43_07635, partial [Flavobacterium sp.]
MKFLLMLVLVGNLGFGQKKNPFPTHYEKGNGNQTSTYQQTIDYYKLLASTFPSIKIQEMGPTDSGEPLHLVLFNPDRQF